MISPIVKKGFNSSLVFLDHEQPFSLEVESTVQLVNSKQNSNTSPTEHKSYRKHTCS